MVLNKTILNKRCQNGFKNATKNVSERYLIDRTNPEAALADIFQKRCS